MQHELQELQPVLATTAKQVETMMTVIASDKEEAATTRLQVGPLKGRLYKQEGRGK
jgi:dynein heavy chain